jgi:hypothetical protein
MELLSKVDKSREAAAEQIQKMNLQLDVIEVSLEQLREDISKPLIMSKTTTPLDSHLGTLEKGFTRLSEIRDKAKLKRDTVYDRFMDGPSMRTSIDAT